MNEQSTYEHYLQVIQDIIDEIRDQNTEEAINLIQLGMVDYPDNAELYLLTALCSYHQNDVGRAIQLCESAHKIAPDCQEAVDSLAVLHTVNGNLHEGVYFAKLATTLEPHADIPDLLPYEFSNFFAALKNAKPSRHYLNGLYRFNFQNFDEAAGEFKKELRRNPDNLMALKKLAHTFVHLKQPSDAIQAFENYQKKVTDDAETIALQAMAHCQLANFEAALKLCETAMSRAPSSIDVALKVLEASLYFGNPFTVKYNEFLDELQKRVTDSFVKDEYETPLPIIKCNDKIHIAVISNQLFSGDVADFLMPLLERIDSTKFDLTVYQQSAAGGPVFEVLKSTAPNWRRIVDLDNDVVELILEREGTDLVIDLCGFSENGRPALFAALGKRKPVINMFCHPFGIGTPGANVVLSDAVTLDFDRENLRVGQSLAECENGLFAINEPSVMGEVSELPAITRDYITFGGTASLAHLSSHTVGLWAKTLHAHPNSKLHLGYIENASNDVKQRIQEIFAAYEVNERVSVWNTDHDHRANPSYFNQIDIFLDSATVNNTITLCHALWMGVPVITLKGQSRNSVIGSSILNSAGKSEWIALDDDGFVQIAKSLSVNLNFLSQTRAELRNILIESKLLDTKSYVISMENTFELIVKKIKAETQ
ncbi:tetratricopeptide repeat protein [Rhodospirillales bacterium]|nr:tetratricopeptide repeat protein [Rhodospirillales bacterium]